MPLYLNAKDPSKTNRPSRNVRYKPTRGVTSNAAIGHDEVGVDGEGQKGAADASGGEDDAGDIVGDGEDDEEAPAAGVAAAKTGLGESMMTLFQRGATGAAE